MAAPLPSPRPTNPDVLSPPTSEWDLMGAPNGAQPSAASHAPRTTFRQFPLFSATFPSLRRLASRRATVTAAPSPPLLVLTFSSTSFLDSTVYDQRTQQPLYVLNTSSGATTVMRSRAWERSVTAADIRWPLTQPAETKGKHLKWVLVQIGSCPWRSGWDVLRTNRNDWYVSCLICT